MDEERKQRRRTCKIRLCKEGSIFFGLKLRRRRTPGRYDGRYIIAVSSRRTHHPRALAKTFQKSHRRDYHRDTQSMKLASLIILEFTIKEPNPANGCAAKLPVRLL